MLNTERFHINYKNSLVNGTKSSALGKSTIVAHRLSVHFQNILTPTKGPQKYLDDINHHVAAFREMLICLGQEKDCPELREKIRKLRCTLLEECQITAQLLIPSDKSKYPENGNNHYLMLLFYLMQLLLGELTKSYRLTQIIPMNMEEYFENRTGPSNLGNVISEILLCKGITPNFKEEELSSILSDVREISLMLNEIQEFVPQELNPNFDIHNSWSFKRKRRLFCCGSLTNFKL
ncbi:uncharacterized protein ACRADG_004731 isoform 1-T2 [Cochliomyia hominivorax]